MCFGLCGLTDTLLRDSQHLVDGGTEGAGAVHRSITCALLDLQGAKVWTGLICGQIFGERYIEDAATEGGHVRRRPSVNRRRISQSNCGAKTPTQFRQQHLALSYSIAGLHSDLMGPQMKR